MRNAVVAPVIALVLFAAGSADAHFKLQEPVDRLSTDATGDPDGTTGTQKMNPCGAGTASNLYTQVHAGATLHVKLTETIGHGGHYRIALVPKWKLVSSDVPEPAVTLSGGSCTTAAIESPVVAPVIADGLFVHTQAQAIDDKLWETDVQLPTETGQATLQILEFMTPHSPQCFYHHCADLEIVAPEVDLGSKGYLVVGPDAGTPVTPDDDAGSSSSSSSSSGSSGSSSSGGCSASGAATPSLGVVALFFVITGLRRGRGRRDRGADRSARDRTPSR
jgi:hypothetical protein